VISLTNQKKVLLFQTPIHVKSHLFHQPPPITSYSSPQIPTRLYKEDVFSLDEKSSSVCGKEEKKKPTPTEKEKKSESGCRGGLLLR
jgi:hypothetical protein